MIVTDFADLDVTKIKTTEHNIIKDLVIPVIKQPKEPKQKLKKKQPIEKKNKVPVQDRTEFFIESAFIINDIIARDPVLKMRAMIEFIAKHLEKQTTTTTTNTYGFNITQEDAVALQENNTPIITNPVISEIRNLLSQIDSEKDYEKRDILAYSFLKKEMIKLGIETVAELNETISKNLSVKVTLLKKKGERFGEVFTNDGKRRLCYFGFAKVPVNPRDWSSCVKEINWSSDEVFMQMLFVSPTKKNGLYEKLLIPEDMFLRKSNMNPLRGSVNKWISENYVAKVVPPQPASNVEVNSLQSVRFIQSNINMNIDGIVWMKNSGDEIVRAIRDGIHIGSGRVYKVHGVDITWFDPLNIKRNESYNLRKMASDVIIKSSECTDLVPIN